MSKDNIYRAFDKQTREMTQPEDICRINFDEGLPIAIMRWNENIIIGDNLILMEFCGKVDKNKVKIFDKDIIIDDGGNKGLVEWNDDHAQFLIKFGDETQELFEVETWGKVIGNELKNPELLEEN